MLGNVARVSHGRTVEETLGGSDGVTAFQRFELSESPLTVLPGVAGGEPELEVRVDESSGSASQDFAGSGPDDRHYRSVTDEAARDDRRLRRRAQRRRAAVGSKNVTAVYRVGLGRAGDVDPRRLSRLKRAHPLLDRVVNVTPISGGAEPADAEAIRSQSTRWIRTFDRAVSLSDLADLALTMPGIARAASRLDQARGRGARRRDRHRRGAAGAGRGARVPRRAPRRDVPLELRGPEPLRRPARRRPRAGPGVPRRARQGRAARGAARRAPRTRPACSRSRRAISGSPPS